MKKAEIKQIAGKCVFCGVRPESKTKEHVIPLWLIELTGERNRNIRFGSTDKSFAFDQFVFPACDECNNEYSKLEGYVKPVILKVLEGKGIIDKEAELLLDWFDKVRIGLWLGGLMLFKNPTEIDPHYYISSRERLKGRDRLLYIGRAEAPGKALQFHSIDDPVFWHVPCFGFLYINGIQFVNVSFFGICGAAMGLPKVKIEKLIIGEGVALKLNMPKRPGWRENWPAAPKGFSILAQASYEAFSPDVFDRKAKYIDQMQLGKLKSKVHLYKDSSLQILGKVPVDVLPPAFKDFPTMRRKSEKLFLRLRRYVVINSGDSADKWHRDWLRTIKELVDAPISALRRDNKTTGANKRKR